MATSHTVTVTLHGSTRLSNSTNGNPRFTLHTSEGDFKTNPDSACSYDVHNLTRGNSTGVDTIVAITYYERSRNVWDIERVS